MFEPIPYADVPKNALFIDVRSPSEYKSATIEGAINLPIFTDEERALIGTMYKQESTDKAKQRGVDIVSVKLPNLFAKIVQLKRDSKRPLVLFCARGGYRSGSLASFLNGMGERVFWLKNGYKGYRNYVRAQIDLYAEEKNFIVLHGNTGIGKTRILNELKNRGLDVLDLEKGANHRGSTLGSVGLGEPTSLKQFESYIYHRLTEFKSNYIIVEAESRRIGKVFVPTAIHDKMNRGIHVNLTADYDFRADILIEDYTSHPSFKEDMAEAISYLGKYIGEKRVQQYLDLLAADKIKPLAIDLMQNYYDPLYEHKADQVEYALIHHIISVEETVDVIEEWYRKEFVPLVEEDISEGE
ncbi:MAG: tRNA 2-selenouridine(34) synthase MnmH [Clostridia bacterium]|nr:tRNA 2-selenouridine(34) synthase MnmH [Clostridia bacterium]